MLQWLLDAMGGKKASRSRGIIKERTVKKRDRHKFSPRPPGAKVIARKAPTNVSIIK